MDYKVINKLKMRELRVGVPNSERAVFDYLEEHFDAIPNMSVFAICEHSFISQATLNRACKRLGFHGFSELKYAIASDLDLLKKTNAPYINRVKSLIDTINYDGIEEILQFMHVGSQLILCGRGGSELVAMYLSRQLLYLGISAIVISEEEMLEHFREYTIIFISSSGNVIKVNEIARIAKGYGMNTIAITSKNSPLSAICNYGYYHNVQIDKLDAIGREQQMHMMIMINNLIEHIRGKLHK